MSNRAALRKLARQRPEASEATKILKGLRHSSDLSAVIVGASLVESCLEHIIVQSISNEDPKLIGRLFDNYGPLSTFESKILIAQAYRVISKPQAEEIQTIRVIRNTFAHARHAVSFDDPPVKNEINTFKMLVAMRSVQKDYDTERRLLDKLEGKEAFLLVVHIMLILLDGEHRRRGGQPIFHEDDSSRGEAQIKSVF